ncbi:hypothetical protein FRC03_012131 [Tulasnella sp. 419]|nr:hypothetical protein FRC03_012131 [Tulasnella sp. 419]
MDPADTASLSVDLGRKIQANFDQVGYKKGDAALIVAEIIKSLTRIEGSLKDQSWLSNDKIHGELSDSENGLGRILRNLGPLIIQATTGVMGTVATRFMELYRASNIRNELFALRRKVQMCWQRVQISRYTYKQWNQKYNLGNDPTTGNKASTPNVMETVIPGANPERMATLDRIEDNIRIYITSIDADGSLEKALIRSRTTDPYQLGVPNKRPKITLKSITTSLIENYIRKNNKEPSPFHGAIIWERYHLASNRHNDSILEIIRALAILRSNKSMSHIDAAKELFCLARVLGDLEMHREAGKIYAWAVEVCHDLALTVDTKVLFDLAIFLQELFVDLASCDQPEGAQIILEQSTTIRYQLEEQEWYIHLPQLAKLINQSCSTLRTRHRPETITLALQEIVEIYRYLEEKESKTYLSLLGLSLHDLCRDLARPNRFDEAAKAGEEAVNIYRELVMHSGDVHLPQLARMLHHFALSLDGSGQYEDAAQVGEEAVALYRQLSEKHKDKRYNLALAQSLDEHAVYLYRLKRYNDAVRVAQEGVKVHEELVKWDSELPVVDLVGSLNSLAIYLKKSGQQEEAEVVQEQATLLSQNTDD